MSLTGVASLDASIGKASAWLADIEAGFARMTWMAFCKTVGLAYVGSNPTPATRKRAGQARSSGPGLVR